MRSRLILPAIALLLLLRVGSGFAQQPKLMLPVGHTGKINNIQFSPDGQRILTAAEDNTVKAWEPGSGKLLLNMNLFAGQHPSDAVGSPVQFSPDGTLLISISRAFREDEEGVGDDKITITKKDTIKVWSAVNGNLLYRFTGTGACRFSPDSKMIAYAADERTIKVVELKTRKQLASLVYPGRSGPNLIETGILCFSPDGKKLVTVADNKLLWVWDIASARLIDLTGLKGKELNYAAFSPDGKLILTYNNDLGNVHTLLSISDAETGALRAIIRFFLTTSNNAFFSPDSRRLFINEPANNKQAAPTAHIFDAMNGKELEFFPGVTQKPEACYFSPDGTKIAAITTDSVIRVHDALTGAVQAEIKEHSGLTTVEFSRDNKKIMTIRAFNQVRIWDAASGDLLTSQEIKIADSYDVMPQLSPDGTKLISLVPGGSMVEVWNTGTGALVTSLMGHTKAYRARFNVQGNKLVLTDTGDIKEWDINAGNLNTPAPGTYKDSLQQDWGLYMKYFSPDRKRNLRFDRHFDGDETPTSVSVYVNDPGNKKDYYYDDPPAKLLATLNGHTDWVWSTYFSPDGNQILTSSRDNTVKIWDAASYNLLFTFFVVNDNDFLVVDKDNHYDGSEGARKLLYFTCGDEVIDLDQLKDQLWVPNLAQRLMKGEKINAPKLTDLNICGLTPVVTTLENTERYYRFGILPRRGGLGETVLYINNIEAGRYPLSALEKKGDHYELTVQKSEFSSFLQSGEENNFVLKAYTSGNEVSSRGIIIKNSSAATSGLRPNLFAVMVGVSDYKGDKIDLKYAAKDAEDLSVAVGAASRKMLNTDGKEHVWIYHINTGTNRDIFPEKSAIKSVFDSIGKKATANDILLIFFAGHGVMEGAKKTFYFLTADASGFDDMTQSGISSSELSEWIKPANIKAQKRILIFDACNSGQAINELVKIGEKDQGLVAARNDDKAEQVKAIDKLNEKSGLFILSASATNQSAYEMSRYSQGLLTYALLKAIKDQPDILEDEKYLSVSRWFNAAEKTVSELIRTTRARQDPQVVSTTNFNLGLVDASVRAAIVMGNEIPLFSSCNFQNEDASIGYDDLKLSMLVNQQLKLESGSATPTLSYMPDNDSRDAYFLSGRYVVNGNTVTLKINIKKGDQPPVQLVVTGTKDGGEELAKKVVKQVMEGLGSKK